MANHEINEEQEAVNKALRMIETSDPVHADVYNALFSILINNDVFLEKLANKMVQQVMISHVMDSTNPDMVMGADQGPVITKLIEKVREQVNVLNTNKLSTSGGVMTGNIEMTSNILSFNEDYKIYNTGGRLSIDSADGSAICFLEGNRLWLNCAGFYAFYAQVSQDGRLIFYNHDHTPVMSIAYNGGIKVKGSIEQNATF